MGLDITFYKESKLDPRYDKEVGYFRKVNFLLKYFNADKDEDNCRKVYITKEMLEQLVTDTNAEIIHHNLDIDGDTPMNEKLQTTEVFFGGCTEYDECYWNDIEYVRDWANETLKDIDWDKDNFFMVAWW